MVGTAAPTTSARTSARRSGRSGLVAGCMAPSPSSAAPRSRLRSTVSAWSSIVWPVSDPVREGPSARGAGPGLEVRPRRHVDDVGDEPRTEPVGQRLDERGLGVGSRSQAVVDVVEGQLEASGGREEREAARVGAAGDGEVDRGRRGGNVQRAASAAASGAAGLLGEDRADALEERLGHPRTRAVGDHGA